MAEQFKDQTIIITGATKGIGRAMAVVFGANGANILATGRTSDELDSICREVERAGAQAVPLVADLALADSPARITQQALDSFGRIDVLINNAAIIHDSASLVEFDAELWQRVLYVNLVAPALLTKAVLPHMIERRHGKIINIASIGGRRGGGERHVRGVRQQRKGQRLGCGGGGGRCFYGGEVVDEHWRAVKVGRGRWGDKVRAPAGEEF